jgi:hypothetical protein
MTDHDPELRIRISKRADGCAVLHCTRRDGSSTWQRQDRRRATFFAFHDLRHFAVETTLGIKQGFFGLIADGWDIPDTEGKGERGPLPPEARLAEHLVGLMDRERIGGAAPISANDVRTLLAQLMEPVADGTLQSPTDDQLRTIRVLADELREKWAASDSELDLTFDRRGFKR